MVRLESHDSNFPLPDKTILVTHTAIARILHLTGMGQEVDDFLGECEDELDELECLAEDGSTNMGLSLGDSEMAW